MELLFRFFSLPQVIENSRQYLLLRTDISPKTIVECPCDKGSDLHLKSVNYQHNYFTFIPPPLSSVEDRRSFQLSACYMYRHGFC